MKILILGSRGTLGQEFQRIYAGFKPTSWDKTELDLANREVAEKKIKKLRPDLIINCAAYNEVDRAEEERAVAFLVNAEVVGNLGKISSEIGATLVHFSTNYVFDGKNQQGYNEDDTPRPLSAYGESKLSGEQELAKHSEKFYLIRTAWLYGQGLGGKQSFVDKILALAKTKDVLQVIDDEFGQPTSAKDLAAATAALIAQEKPFGIYHLTNEGSCSWYDWAKQALKLAGLKTKVEPVAGEIFKRQAKRPKYGILNNNKFIKLRPWKEALEEYLSR